MAIVKFPRDPSDGMLFEPAPGILYRYNSRDRSWYRIDTTQVGVATPSKAGLMSKEDYKKLQGILLPPPQSTVQGEDCDITFKEGTISIYSTDGSVTIENQLRTGATSAPWQIHENTAGFNFKLNLEQFLEEVDSRGKIKKVRLAGKDGAKGMKGDPGKDMLDTGPVGERGEAGANSPFTGTITPEAGNISVDDSQQDRAIVDVSTERINENENYIVITRANIGNPDACPDLINPSNFDSPWLLVLDQKTSNVTRRLEVTGDCAITCRICVSQVYYLNIEAIIEAVQDRYVAKLEDLRLVKEQLVSDWLRVMAALFNEQKYALCCALENCMSRKRNQDTRRYIEQSRIGAAQANQSLIISTNDDDKYISSSNNNNCPTGDTAYDGGDDSRIVYGQECDDYLVTMALDARIHTKDPRTQNGGRWLEARLPPGDYIVEVLECCANFSRMPMQRSARPEPPPPTVSNWAPQKLIDLTEWENNRRRKVSLSDQVRVLSQINRATINLKYATFEDATYRKDIETANNAKKAEEKAKLLEIIKSTKLPPAEIERAKRELASLDAKYNKKTQIEWANYKENQAQQIQQTKSQLDQALAGQANTELGKLTENEFFRSVEKEFGLLNPVSTPFAGGPNVVGGNVPPGLRTPYEVKWVNGKRTLVIGQGAPSQPADSAKKLKVSGQRCVIELSGKVGTNPGDYPAEGYPGYIDEDCKIVGGKYNGEVKSGCTPCETSDPIINFFLKNSRYTGRVAVMHTAVLPTDAPPAVDTVNPLVLRDQVTELPSLGPLKGGTFSKFAEAKQAYVGLTALFNHAGGHIKVWMPDPDAGMPAQMPRVMDPSRMTDASAYLNSQRALEGGVVVGIRSRKCVEAAEQGTGTEPKVPYIYVYRDRISPDNLIGIVDPYVVNDTHKDNYGKGLGTDQAEVGSGTDSAVLTVGPRLEPEVSKAFFVLATDGLGFYHVHGSDRSAGTTVYSKYKIISNSQTIETPVVDSGDVTQTTEYDGQVFSARWVFDEETAGVVLNKLDTDAGDDWILVLEEADFGDLTRLVAASESGKEIVLSQGASGSPIPQQSLAEPFILCRSLTRACNVPVAFNKRYSLGVVNRLKGQNFRICRVLPDWSTANSMIRKPFIYAPAPYPCGSTFCDVKYQVINGSDGQIIPINTDSDHRPRIDGSKVNIAFLIDQTSSMAYEYSYLSSKASDLASFLVQSARRDAQGIITGVQSVAMSVVTFGADLRQRGNRSLHILVLDRSSSMARADEDSFTPQTRWESAIERANTFINNLPKDGSADVILLPFGTRAPISGTVNDLRKTVVSNAQVAEDLKLLIAGYGAPDASQGTALWNAVGAAFKTMNNVAREYGSKWIYVVSDGGDKNSIKDPADPYTYEAGSIGEQAVVEAWRQIVSNDPYAYMITADIDDTIFDTATAGGYDSINLRSTYPADYYEIMTRSLTITTDGEPAIKQDFTRDIDTVEEAIFTSSPLYPQIRPEVASHPNVFSFDGDLRAVKFELPYFNGNPQLEVSYIPPLLPGQTIEKVRVKFENPAYFGVYDPNYTPPPSTGTISDNALANQRIVIPNNRWVKEDGDVPLLANSTRHCVFDGQKVIIRTESPPGPDQYDDLVPAASLARQPRTGPMKGTVEFVLSTPVIEEYAGPYVSPGLKAIEYAADNLAWQSDAVKIIVLVTDKDSTPSPNVTESTVAAALERKGIILNSVLKLFKEDRPFTRISCGSVNNQYSECQLSEPIGEAWVINKSPSVSCIYQAGESLIPNSEAFAGSFGITHDGKLWVDHGCSAEFGVRYLADMAKSANLVTAYGVPNNYDDPVSGGSGLSYQTGGAIFNLQDLRNANIDDERLVTVRSSNPASLISPNYTDQPFRMIRLGTGSRNEDTSSPYITGRVKDQRDVINADLRAQAEFLRMLQDVEQRLVTLDRANFLLAQSGLPLITQADIGTYASRSATVNERFRMVGRSGEIPGKATPFDLSIDAIESVRSPGYHVITGRFVGSAPEYEPIKGAIVHLYKTDANPGALLSEQSIIASTFTDDEGRYIFSLPVNLFENTRSTRFLVEMNLYRIALNSNWKITVPKDTLYGNSRRALKPVFVAISNAVVPAKEDGTQITATEPYEIAYVDDRSEGLIVGGDPGRAPYIAQTFAIGEAPIPNGVIPGVNITREDLAALRRRFTIRAIAAPNDVEVDTNNNHPATVIANGKPYPYARIRPSTIRVGLPRGDFNQLPGPNAQPAFMMDVEFEEYSTGTSYDSVIVRCQHPYVPGMTDEEFDKTQPYAAQNPMTVSPVLKATQVVEVAPLASTYYGSGRDYLRAPANGYVRGDQGGGVTFADGDVTTPASQITRSLTTAEAAMVSAAGRAPRGFLQEFADRKLVEIQRFAPQLDADCTTLIAGGPSPVYNTVTGVPMTDATLDGNVVAVYATVNALPGTAIRATVYDTQGRGIVLKSIATSPADIWETHTWLITDVEKYINYESQSLELDASLQVYRQYFQRDYSQYWGVTQYGPLGAIPTNGPRSAEWAADPTSPYRPGNQRIDPITGIVTNDWRMNAFSGRLQAFTDGLTIKLRDLKAVSFEFINPDTGVIAYFADVKVAVRRTKAGLQQVTEVVMVDIANFEPFGETLDTPGEIPLAVYAGTTTTPPKNVTDLDPKYMYLRPDSDKVVTRFVSSKDNGTTDLYRLLRKTKVDDRTYIKSSLEGPESSIYRCGFDDISAALGDAERATLHVRMRVRNRVDDNYSVLVQLTDSDGNTTYISGTLFFDQSVATDVSAWRTYPIPITINKAAIEGLADSQGTEKQFNSAMMTVTYTYPGPVGVEDAPDIPRLEISSAYITVERLEPTSEDADPYAGEYALAKLKLTGQPTSGSSIIVGGSYTDDGNANGAPQKITFVDEIIADRLSPVTTAKYRSYAFNTLNLGGGNEDPYREAVFVPMEGTVTDVRYVYLSHARAQARAAQGQYSWTLVGPRSGPRRPVTWDSNGIYIMAGVVGALEYTTDPEPAPVNVLVPESNTYTEACGGVYSDLRAANRWKSSQGVIHSLAAESCGNWEPVSQAAGALAVVKYYATGVGGSKDIWNDTGYVSFHEDNITKATMMKIGVNWKLSAPAYVPASKLNHAIHVRMRYENVGTPTHDSSITVSLHQGSPFSGTSTTVIKTKTFVHTDISTSFVDYVVELTEDDVTLITDYADLHLVLERQAFTVGKTNNYRTFHVSNAAFKIAIAGSGAGGTDIASLYPGHQVKIGATVEETLNNLCALILGTGVQNDKWHNTVMTMGLVDTDFAFNSNIDCAGVDNDVMTFSAVRAGLTGNDLVARVNFDPADVMRFLVPGQTFVGGVDPVDGPPIYTTYATSEQDTSAYLENWWTIALPDTGASQNICEREKTFCPDCVVVKCDRTDIDLALKQEIMCVEKSEDMAVPLNKILFTPTSPCEGCLMHWKQVEWYERGWRIGACCGALIEIDGQQWIIVKRSIGIDMSCGGGESEETECIKNFVSQGKGHPAIAWPTIDGEEFIGRPHSGFVRFTTDTALSEQLRGAVAQGRYTILRGNLTSANIMETIPLILFPGTTFELGASANPQI